MLTIEAEMGGGGAELPKGFFAAFLAVFNSTEITYLGGADRRTFIRIKNGNDRKGEFMNFGPDFLLFLLMCQNQAIKKYDCC